MSVSTHTLFFLFLSLSSNGISTRSRFLFSSVIVILVPKHAGADQHFGLRGSDERGFVVPGDVKFPVEDERLSEHRLHGGGGE